MSNLSLTETQVVAAFASVCPYGIIVTSIEKRYPPAPDVRCQISDGSYVAFEVTESIYDDIAKQSADSIFMKRKLKNYIESLSIKDAFNKKFNNAMIFIYPKDRKLDKNIFSSNIKRLIEYLLTKAPEGKEFTFPDDKFNGEISRGNFNGPIYDTSFGSDFNDCLINRIDSKFNKDYRTNLPIDLLIHYYMQPGPFAWDINEGINFIKQNLKNSYFRRAWIYSTKENKILAAYPEI
jgi:hypothetical protein